jgi:hypothetical protein
MNQSSRSAVTIICPLRRRSITCLKIRFKELAARSNSYHREGDFIPKHTVIQEAAQRPLFLNVFSEVITTSNTHFYATFLTLHRKSFTSPPLPRVFILKADCTRALKTRRLKRQL